MFFKLKIQSLIALLQGQQERTLREERLLTLLLEERHLLDAQEIVTLEFQESRTQEENRRLELLLNPATAEYAERIVTLEFQESRTQKENRRLELLLNPATAENADKIIFSEEKQRFQEREAEGRKILLRIFCLWRQFVNNNPVEAVEYTEKIQGDFCRPDSVSLVTAKGEHQALFDLLESQPAAWNGWCPISLAELIEKLNVEVEKESCETMNSHP